MKCIPIVSRSTFFLMLMSLFSSFYSQIYGLNADDYFYFSLKNEKFKTFVDNRFFDELKSRYVFINLLDNSAIVEADSLIQYSDGADTLYVFTDKSRFIAFCSKRNNQYFMTEIHDSGESGEIEEIFVDDFNHDSNIDFAFTEYNEAQSSFYIYSFDKLQKKFIYVLREDQLGGSEIIYFQNIHINNGIIYLAYQKHGSSIKKVNIGIIDYSKDDSKEFFFRPLCILSIKKWEKLIKKNHVHLLIEKYGGERFGMN